MGYVRLGGVVLGVGLAFAATAAAPALAGPPEFGRCLAKPFRGGAGFSNASCTKAGATGAKYEWTAPADPHIAIRLKEGTPVLEGTNLSKITCTAVAGGGEISGPKEITGVVLKLNGCETSKGAVNTFGRAPNEVVTKELTGVLGIEKVGLVEGVETPAKDKLAVELHPTAGTTFLEAECAGLTFDVRGSIVLNVTANKIATPLKPLTLKASEKSGEQKPDGFEGASIDEHILETSTAGGPFEETGLAMILALGDEEPKEPIEASSIN